MKVEVILHTGSEHNNVTVPWQSEFATELQKVSSGKGAQDSCIWHIVSLSSLSVHGSNECRGIGLDKD